MDSTVSRKLEETFRDTLATSPALSGVAVRASHEEGARTLPCAVVSARSSGRSESVRLGDAVAEEIDLRAECMVHGGDDGSSAAVERLAEAVQAGIENATGITGWRLLVLEFESVERGFDGQVRTITLAWKVTALPL